APHARESRTGCDRRRLRAGQPGGRAGGHPIRRHRGPAAPLRARSRDRRDREGLISSASVPRMEDTAKPSRALPIGVAAAVAIVVFGVLFAVNGPRGKPDTALVTRGDDKPALTPMAPA